MTLKSSSLLIVGALLAGFTGGALGAKLFAGTPDSDAEKATSEKKKLFKDGAGAPRDTERLLERLNALERRVQRLTFSQAQASTTGAPAADSNSLEGEAPTARAVDDPVFEAAVRDVVEQVEAERGTERRSRRQQSSERWLGALNDRLGLTEDQSRKIAEIAQSHRDALRASFREEGRPMLRSERRARVKELSAQVEQEVVELLDEEQKTKYAALAEEDRISGGAFGRRGRGGAGRGERGGTGAQGESAQPEE